MVFVTMHSLTHPDFTDCVRIEVETGRLHISLDGHGFRGNPAILMDREEWQMLTQAVDHALADFDRGTRA